MNPQPLILGADEHRAEDVARDEEHQESVVEMFVMQGVEDAQEDEADGAGDGGEGGEDAEHLLRSRCVVCEFAEVPEPSLEEEARCEGDDGGGAHGYEEWFEGGGADVGYVAVEKAVRRVKGWGGGGAYAMDWVGAIEARCGECQSTAQVRSIARSMASQTKLEKAGKTQYDIAHIVVVVLIGWSRDVFRSPEMFGGRKEQLSMERRAKMYSKFRVAVLAAPTRIHSQFSTWAAFRGCRRSLFGSSNDVKAS